jgi:site-specific recombinase XerD
MQLLARGLALVTPSSVPLDLTQQALPADRNPALVYLAALAQGSRRTMRQALDVIASMIAPATNADTFPWHRLAYQHAAAVRSRLAEVYAPATANKMLAALKGVLKHSFNLGLMPAEEYARACAVGSIKGTRVPPGRCLGSGELRALFDVCAADTPGGARNVGLLAVLYGCGLRRSEAVGLDLDDFDPAASSLTVRRAKGGKQRVVYATHGGRLALDAWLRFRGDVSGPLFLPVTQAGVVAVRRLSDQAVYDLVRRLARRAGVATFGPHDLRRSHISDAMDAGADISALAALVGHSQVSTTARYDRRGERARRRAAETVHVPFAPAGEPR